MLQIYVALKVVQPVFSPHVTKIYSTWLRTLTRHVTAARKNVSTYPTIVAVTKWLPNYVPSVQA